MKVDSTSKVGAAEALARLAAGNERFVRGESLQPESHAERRKALIKAQAPFAVVLTCSDSRVVPELIFDQGIGDLFVLRVAGNIIDDAVLGTVEYAVGELGVQLVVVMGHQTCGAVSAAMQAAQRLPGESASGAPQPAQTLNPRTRDPGPRVQGAAASRGAVSHLDELIRAISPAVARSGGDLETAIRLNATDVSETLRTHGMVLGPAIETGALAIVPAYYSLDTGTVEFLKAGELEPRADPRVPMGTEAHALLRETRVLLDLRAESLEGLVLEGLHHLREAALLTNEEERRVRNRLRASGEPVPAADLGHGVGVIRVIAPELRRPRIVLANCPRSRFGLPEGTPWAFLWIVIGPAEVEAPSNEELEPFGWMLLDDRFIGRALEALAKGELLDAYAEYLAFVETPIEREEIPPELERSGRLFGGILNDVKRRLPSYGSDWRDGFHPKILASVLFLFFACFAPAVAFGGLLSVLTEGSIGAVEMILATFVCGTVYALASGQPMTILGSTGPVIVFMGIVYELCRSLDIPYFPTLACIGLWTALILIILAATDASRLIRHFTRFTDETFAALIALIFVVEALRDTFKGFASPEIPYDTALLSLVLAIGTYAIATQLSRFRRSVYLRRHLREFLADFGPAIAILAMTGVAVWLHPVRLEVLAVPEHFAPTTDRAWLVSPFDAPAWVWAVSFIPALLVSVLLFLDQNITVRLVNDKQHRLRKGAGYHLDLMVLGILVGACALFGLPWMVAATVRSLNHVRALAQTEGRGDEERIVAVREQRVSGLLVHLLVGASLLFMSLLATIPMSVLFGLFLYMGIASTRGSQFFERLRLWVMDPKHYPPTHFLRRVPRRVVHVFTAIQAASLIILWVVKTSILGILFPLFIALLIPLRMALGRIFDAKDLAFLDAEEAPEEEAERALD